MPSFFQVPFGPSPRMWLITFHRLYGGLCGWGVNNVHASLQPRYKIISGVWLELLRLVCSVSLWDALWQHWGLTSLLPKSHLWPAGSQTSASVQLTLWVLTWWHSFAPFFPLYLTYPVPPQLSENFSQWVTSMRSLIKGLLWGAPAKTSDFPYRAHSEMNFPWLAWSKLIWPESLCFQLEIVCLCCICTRQLCIGFIIELATLVFLHPVNSSNLQ